MARLFCLIVSMALFVLNYTICEFIAGNNIEQWWKLKYTIFSLIILLLVLGYKYDEKTYLGQKYVRFITSWFIGLMAFDVIDRILFSPTLGWNDYLGLGFSALASWYNEKRLNLINSK